MAEEAYVTPTETVTIKSSNWSTTRESLLLWMSKHQGVTRPLLWYLLEIDPAAPVGPNSKDGLPNS